MGSVRRETFYDLLGVEKTASFEEIERQYFRLVELWRALTTPDSHALVQSKLLELTQAYHTLKEPTLRSSYDSSLDFDFVLIDGKVRDPDMEEAYQVYLDKRSSQYQKVLDEFSEFRDELGDSLWVLKTTTVYLLVCLLVFTVFYFSFSLLFDSLPWSIKTKSFVSHFSVPVYLGIVFGGFYLFRRAYQMPMLRLRKNNKKSS